MSMESGSIFVDVKCLDETRRVIDGLRQPITIGHDESVNVVLPAVRSVPRLHTVLSWSPKAKRWQFRMLPSMHGEIFLRDLRGSKERPHIEDLATWAGHLKRDSEGARLYTVWTHRLVINLTFDAMWDTSVRIFFAPYRRGLVPRRSRSRPANPPPIYIS